MKLVYVGLICLCIFAAFGERLQPEDEKQEYDQLREINFDIDHNPDNDEEFMEQVEKENDKDDKEIESQQEKDFFTRFLNVLRGDVENEDTAKEQFADSYLSKVRHRLANMVGLIYLLQFDSHQVS